MSTHIKTQAELASVQQFDCPGCGNALEVLSPRAQYVSCQYCGSVLDHTSEEHQILEELGKPSRHAPMSFVRVGQLATFNGQDYQVISRTRWRMRYKEYYMDEDGSGYSNEVWIYDEWLMISADRTYFYLVEDREGYKISDEIIPETPSLVPQDLRMSFYKQQPRQIVREYGEAEVVHFEGESNYRINRGDNIRFGSFSERGIHYSVEWRMNKGGNEIKEVEFFKETPISRRKVLEAFGNNKEIEKLKQTESNWRYVFQVAAMTWLAMLLGMFYSWMSDGREMFRESFNPAQATDQTPLTVGPIQLNDPSLYRLVLQAGSMSENSEMYLFAYLLDGEEKAINTMDGEFFYYTGVDDEGRWTESNRKSEKLFRLKEPGTYYVQILRDSAEQVRASNVDVVIYQNVWLTRYFVIGLILLLLPMIYAWSRSGR